MKALVNFYAKLFLFGLLVMLFLSSCSSIPGIPGVIPAETQKPAIHLEVTDPEIARDIALAYLRTYHAGAGTTQDAFWFSEVEPSGGLVGSSTVKYRLDDWTVTVTYPIVAPENSIFTVTIENSVSDERWQGLVDAYGQVVETSYIAASLPSPIPPTATATSIPTETQIPVPTATPVPTNTPVPSPTSTPVTPCNAAKFIADVTIEDGTTFYPGASFVKTWRLKNVGTCTWTSAYDLIFYEGSLMDGNKTQSLPASVKPGETIDISISLKAPKAIGDYQGQWMLRDANGTIFGLGDRVNKPFWVSISVVDFNEGSFKYDFALNYCAATWWSETEKLPCPGFTSSKTGYVYLLSKADLENRKEDEPTLWVHPNYQRYGWVEGVYPALKIEDGDVFKAWVGCLSGYDRCSLTFYLKYIDRDGKSHDLGEWEETYDGEVTKLEVDLSDLAGQNIRLILGAIANTKNFEDAQGFWFVPRIE